ncbi:MAG: hypothetical protein ACLSHC_11765 [Bilophila wadsworthia]
MGFAIAEVPNPRSGASLPRSWLPSLLSARLVWLPVCIWLWLTGSTVACTALPSGALVVAGVDNLLRPFFLKTGIDASVVTLILPSSAASPRLGR